MNNNQMTDYSSSEYNGLYEEILKDYNWTWGKFSPIPYPMDLHKEKKLTLKPKPIRPTN